MAMSGEVAEAKQELKAYLDEHDGRVIYHDDYLEISVVCNAPASQELAAWKTLLILLRAIFVTNPIRPIRPFIQQDGVDIVSTPANSFVFLLPSSRTVL